GFPSVVGPAPAKDSPPLNTQGPELPGPPGNPEGSSSVPGKPMVESGNGGAVGLPHAIISSQTADPRAPEQGGLTYRGSDRATADSRTQGNGSDSDPSPNNQWNADTVPGEPPQLLGSPATSSSAREKRST